MRHLLANLVRLVCIFGCAYLAWCVVISQDLWPKYLKVQEDRRSQPDDQGKVCLRPKMEVYTDLVMKQIKTYPKLKCSPEKDWLYLTQGVVKADQEAVKRHGPFKCNLDFYERLDEYKSKVAKSLTFSSEEGEVTLVADFFQANCQAKDGRKWSNIMAGVHRTRKSSGQMVSGNEPKWNVFMFGFDSVSRLHFMRKLPKTYKLLTAQLKAIVLEGYNIVGDGTPQALIPILTGFAEPELPETRKRIPNSKYVNVYPWVWNNYSANGYVTAFAEDTPSVGIFTYRLNGFKEQPTDHFLRSFYVEADKQFGKHEKLCLGSVPRHMVMLNWLRQVYEVYKDHPKFVFGFHGELSHDDFNLVGVADDDLVDFITKMKDDGLLKDTFLIVMSDHGHRYSSMRTFAQGKQEERLPFFSITVPESFQKLHGQLVDNLKENAYRVTTPFDINPTLHSLLNPSIVPPVGNTSHRSIGLFSKVPVERTCAQAGIEPHWCTCLAWEEISVDEPISKEAAQSVVDFINGLTSSQESSCARLTLDKVTRSERYQASKDVLSYKGNSDKDGFVADLSDKTKPQVVIYSVQLMVHPSGGIYEASVTYNTKFRTFHVDQKELSRVNEYGSQPHCVQEQFPHLMKYCYCKVQKVK